MVDKLIQANHMQPAPPGESGDDKLERYARDLIDDLREQDPGRAKKTAQDMDRQGLKAFFGVRKNSPQIQATEQPAPGAFPTPISIVSTVGHKDFSPAPPPTKSSHWSGH